MQLCHAGLMTRGLNEPDAVYGLIAESVTVNGLDYTFAIRDGATFTDGSPITAADVVFTFDTFREEGHPALRQLLNNVDSTTAVDDLTVTVTFSPDASNRLPPTIATLPIISSAYYSEKPFSDADLQIPITSGAYTVGDFRPGRFVDFTLRDNWWGADVPSAKGQNNFGSVRVDYFRERIAGFEAFKTGDTKFREEFTSKTWATGYDFPAVTDGRVVLREFPDGRPSGAQGFFLNTRRAKFSDIRTRKALGLAFDFEWLNRNVFYSLYKRTPSYFVGSDLMAEGLPSDAERAILEPFGDQLPEGIFGEAYLPPVSDGSGRDRKNLGEANRLLAEAGWQRVNGRLVDADGQPFTIEFLNFQPSFNRVVQPFIDTLGLLGITASIRMVETSQYQARVRDFDFDVTTRRFAFSPTPGETVREYFVSSMANEPGSNNLSGISDPVVDGLVEIFLDATTREELVTAARALDRVLRLGHYWVPQWYKGSHTVAYWDEFGVPENKPKYDLPVSTTWWAKNA